MTAPAHRTAGTAALEELAGRGWPATEEQWLGRWWLRAAAGFTGRANSCLPLGDPGLPLDAALTAVRRWYAERRLPARFQLEPGTPLDAALSARGWAGDAQRGSVLVQTAGADAVAAALPHPRGVPTEVSAAPPEGWLALYRGGQGLPAVARQVLGRPRGVRFVTTTYAGTVVAGVRGVVLGGWVGIAGLETHPAWRRRGLARAVLARLVDDARRAGVGQAYLQVQDSNVAATALYEGLGFTTHHRYHYRVAEQR